MAYLAGEMVSFTACSLELNTNFKTDNANGKVHMDSKMDAELVVEDKKLES